MRISQSVYAGLLVGLGLALTGCSTPPEQISPDPVLSQLECPDPGPGGLAFWMQKQSQPIGTSRTLSPFVAQRPGVYDSLPSACLSEVTISPENAGTIERAPNGDYRVEIAATAPLGVPIDVRAHYNGQRLSGRLFAYDPAQSPLIGYWSQDEAQCDPATVIRELIFSADGTFAVTWMPFEVYQDYWGQYEYDASSGDLNLTVLSGNADPTGVTSGQIDLEDRVLTLNTASFGRRSADLAECRAPFR